MSNIDLDIDLHLYEKHKEKLIKLPMMGNLDKRIEFIIAKVKDKTIKNIFLAAYNK